MSFISPLVTACWHRAYLLGIMTRDSTQEFQSVIPRDLLNVTVQQDTFSAIKLVCTSLMVTDFSSRATSVSRKSLLNIWEVIKTKTLTPRNKKHLLTEHAHHKNITFRLCCLLYLFQPLKKHNIKNVYENLICLINRLCTCSKNISMLKCV